ncbi:MAG: hypothetical protein ACOVQM_18590 [Pirellula sp.]|jgi:hypothetical protein
MSEAATQLLNTFSSLSASEQHEVLIALLRSSGQLSPSTLNDDQLVAIAEEVFLSLEVEELHGDKNRKR